MSDPDARKPPYPTTPDGRYFVVRGRLWRTTNPALPAEERRRLQRALMSARSALGRARKAGDDEARLRARREIDEAKVALGERGAPWWDDGAPDFNRKMAANTPYRAWFERVEAEAGGPTSA